MNKLFLRVCILALMLVFVCGFAFAQSFPTNKGSKFLYGSFVFSSAGGDLYEVDNDRMTSIQFNSSLGYFVTPGLALGGKFLLARYSQGDESQTTWGIGPHVLYFIGGSKPKATVKGVTCLRNMMGIF